MKTRISRVIGAVGGALALLPWIVSAVVYALQFFAVDNSSPYASLVHSDLIQSFLTYNLIPLIVSAAGFTGGLLAMRKHILSNVWLMRVPLMLLIAAGVLALKPCQTNLRTHSAL